MLLALEKRRLSYIPCGIIALDLAKAKKITTYLQGARQPHTIIGGPRAYRNFPPFPSLVCPKLLHSKVLSATTSFSLFVTIVVAESLS